MIEIYRRAVWLFACAIFVIAFTGAAWAQSAPRAFVETIYMPYLKKGYSGVVLSKPERIRRYFERGLATAMIRDMAEAKKRDEVPTLNGDPFVDAQDWEIANLAIEVKSAGPKATATVKFSNFREPRTVTLDLVKTADGWRIAEINAPSGSLRKLFKLK